MGEAAIRAARAAGYYNAGTVEFLVDANRQLLLPGNEHAAAGGASGDRTGHRARPGAAAARNRGGRAAAVHAGGGRAGAARPSSAAFTPKIRPTISCRSPGKITRLAEPAGPGVRLDSGVYEGWTVPLDYDPLLAKLAVWAATRERCRRARMSARWANIDVGGIRTNIGFFRQILEDPEFRAGNLHTGFIDEFFARA